MVVPPVIGGVALLVAFGRRGLVGQYLDDWFDIRLAYTRDRRRAGGDLREHAVLRHHRGGGAARRRPPLRGRRPHAGCVSPSFVLRHVTLPSIRGALGAGAALAWARALGEFGATITFAGSFAGQTQTMPLAIYDFLDTDVHAAILLSLVLLAVSVVVLAGLRDRWLGAP